MTLDKLAELQIRHRMVVVVCGMAKPVSIVETIKQMGYKN
jgi:hypothetical protein